MEANPVRISAVVLNYNGGRMVMDCLASLVAQEPAYPEIVCVDNASIDGSLDAVEAKYPEIAIIRLESNLGFAEGMNRGIRASSGEAVALINFDVVLEPTYLARCAEVLAEDATLGGVTGKLLRPGPHDPPILDTTGHLVYRNRRAVDRGEREPDAGQYDTQRGLFGVCGAAPVYRRAMLDDVALDGNVFDPDFFAYFEDFDLNWRAQLRGWGFAFAPAALGTHHRGGSGGKASTFVLACNHRNRLLVMLRNDHPASFLRHLPGITYTELRASLHMLRLRPAALLMAWGQFLDLLPAQLARRRLIQASRKVAWEELEHWFERYDYGLRAMRNRARQRAAVR
ncbi:MAG: glycosyltransferase family 2 protein [Actinomycetota bacterium]